MTGAISSAISMSTLGWISSGPHALVGSRFLSSLRTPAINTVMFSILGVTAGWYGIEIIHSLVKTLENCLFRISAFSKFVSASFSPSFNGRIL